jgi:hypothetical protein
MNINSAPVLSFWPRPSFTRLEIRCRRSVFAVVCVSYNATFADTLESALGDHCNALHPPTTSIWN